MLLKYMLSLAMSFLHLELSKGNVNRLHVLGVTPSMGKTSKENFSGQALIIFKKF